MFFCSPARGVIRSVAFPPRSGHPELVGSLPNGDGDSMDVSGFADPDELAPPKKPSGKRPRLVGSLVHENDDSMDVSVSMLFERHDAGCVEKGMSGLFPSGTVGA